MHKESNQYHGSAVDTMSFLRRDISQGPQLEAVLAVRYKPFVPPEGVPARQALGDSLAKRFPAGYGQKQEYVDRNAQNAVSAMLHNGYIEEAEGGIRITSAGEAIISRMRLIPSSCGATTEIRVGQQNAYCWHCGGLL